MDTEDHLYSELSRLNNELINAQRDLVQRNMRLERAEESLRKAQLDLQQQIHARTQQLEHTLAALKEEVHVRSSAEQKLRALSLTILRLQDGERRRVARDLHDTAGQTLTALKLSLHMLQGMVLQTPPTADMFTDLNRLADQALQEIRTTSHLLHPPLLDEAGFGSAAAWFIEGFNKRSPIQVSLHLPKHSRLPSSVEIVFFRVLQESLTNVTRHSGASAVEVSLEFNEWSVVMSVQDYGQGISPEKLAEINCTGGSIGVGISGMRERLKELGGSLEIESAATGTLLRARVPNSAIALSG